MIGKVLDFLISVAINGFLAIFISLIFYVILFVILSFAMIPVSIIAGEETVRNIMNLVARDDIGYKIIYVIVFVTMLADDLNIPNPKTLLKRWKQSYSA